MSEYFVFGDKKFVEQVDYSYVPAGYSLAQIGEYHQASSGNPAVIVLNDAPDTIFDKQKQLFVYAINFGVKIAAVASLFGESKALTNTRDDERASYLLGTSLNAQPPRIDKLRTFDRNTHAVRDYNSTIYQVWTMNGNQDPPMKPGKVRPSSVDDINSGRVKATDYLYNPQETLFAFMVCNNFNTKPGNQTAISPFPNGILYDWTPSPLEPYTFFPLISKEPVILSKKELWTRVSNYQNPYRRL